MYSFSKLAVVAITASTALAFERPTPVAFERSGSWHHPEGHHVERLFKRDTVGTPTFGSAAWQAQYPDPSNNWPPKNLPQAWVDTLNAAVAAGKIPNLPVPTIGPAGSPVYPNGLDPTGNVVCSATYECRATGDIWDGPPGTVALAFDDGPLAPSPRLYEFLKGKGVHAMHFFIGGNVRANPQIFMQAYANNSDPIAVHTYTHPYMTIQSNMNVLAELGYTMQIIYDSTGGRVPKFWRPPYGDADNRVRAIAHEVFGLTTVIWNQDSEDWELTYGAVPLSTVENNLKSFYAMPKSPGLVILEHELSDNSVNAFIYSWDLMQAGGWKPISIPDAANVTFDPGHAWYQNAQDDVAQLASMSFGDGPGGTASIPPSGASSTTSGSVTATATTPGSSASSGTGSLTRTTSATDAPTSSSPSSSGAPVSSTTGAASRTLSSSSLSTMSMLGAVALLFVHF